MTPGIDDFDSSTDARLRRETQELFNDLSRQAEELAIAYARRAVQPILSPGGGAGEIDAGTHNHAAYQELAEKDAANGYAGLTSSTKIALAQLQEVLGLTDLSNVVIASPSTGQVLKYNGTNWVNDVDDTGGGGAITITELDGNPSGTPATLKFPNGTLTDNGDGSFTFTPAASGGGAWTQIGEVIIGSPSPTLELSGIPGTYRHLKVTLVGAYQDATSDSGVFLRFNDDAGTNYDYEVLTANNTTVSSARTAAAAQANIGGLPGSTLPNQAGVSEIIVFDYARTVFRKSWIGESFRRTATATIRGSFGGTWLSTSAITKVSIHPFSGNFASDTVLTVWGIQ
jgi:hypothetical protein